MRQTNYSGRAMNVSDALVIGSERSSVTKGSMEEVHATPALWQTWSNSDQSFDHGAREVVTCFEGSKCG